MITAGHDGQIVFLNGVNEPVGVVDPPRPESRQVLAERFGFAESFEGVPHRVLNQCVDPFQRLSVLTLPVNVVLPGGRGPKQTPKVQPAALTSSCLYEVVEWTCRDARRSLAFSASAQSPSNC